MRKLVLGICLCTSVATIAQPAPGGKRDESWKKIYRASATKINDLVHTKLDVRFDYDKAYMYGKAWITLQPHFYATDSLTLDAKGMNINAVALVANGKQQPLKYEYDSAYLYINLGRSYKQGEKYTVFIDYVAKPNEYQAKGSAAITDAKGLYFINPKGEDKNKPTQIWTQGETEATSVWCPTIDKSNQKTTEEITMTVPAKYVTLSNGLLVSQKKNTDGTRTDTWKMDLPHSPYLFFMGVGDFAIIKDSYKGKEVSYYVEKDYEKVARRIFGLTPEMIGFYSKILGVDYPWAKYAQMTGRDYVSGAMENTTATLHTDALQQNARQLSDGNKYEDYVAHELFHQWFGDYVTAESWSNLTVNESFANYSETLWFEYKHGKDAGLEKNYVDMRTYTRGRNDAKDLVRFYYADKEDMFDAVSYNKGGRILNMLRHYVGDSAFFKSLNLYLTTNKFKSAEAHNLRLAFEEVTGQDLNWYWNQWYFGSGHPLLDINYGYDAENRVAQVFISQKQTTDKVFKLPIDIDVYVGNKKERHSVWMNNKQDTFSFKVTSKPDLINVDGDKILLAVKTDHKTLAEYAHQYKYAGNYVDRREAIEYAAQHISEAGAKELLSQGLSDPYYGIRNITLKVLSAKDLDATLLAKVEGISKNDERRLNRAAAINILSDLEQPKYEAFFLANTSDSSYSVAGAALEGLAKLNEQKAISLLPVITKDVMGDLKPITEQLTLLTKSDADFDSVYNKYKSASLLRKVSQVYNLITYLSVVEDKANFKKGLDAVIETRDQLSAFSPAYKENINKELTRMKKRKEAAKAKSSNPSVIDEEIKMVEEKLK